MINKDRLLEITDLNLADKIEQMNDNALEEYSNLLYAFTINFPEQEEKIKNAMNAKDYNTLTNELTAICSDLEKFYADEFAKDCRKKIPQLTADRHEKTEAYICFFLSNLSMLSIEIQMAEQAVDSPDSQQADGQSKMRTQGNKILAVDDTVLFLTMLKTTLQETRYKLTCVTSGKDALKFLEKNKPDLFLLDIEMPEMNGFELAIKLREEGYKEPIIFLTGNARREYFAMAIKSGATDFIIKPINKELLLGKIAKYIM